MNLPSDICNQALDAIGSEVTLGDIQEGSREAQVLLRAYSQCLRQLQRAAHWDFCRKQAPMTLLADATGQTAEVGTLVQIPWTYCYAYPTDCLKMRFVPQNYANVNPGTPPGNIAISTTVPLTTQGQPAINRMRIIPSRFTVGTDFNYPPPAGTPYDEVQGVAPTACTVVLSNVKFAQGVYTAFMPYPSLWDSLFRSALVAYLASEVALALTKDKKFGLELRDRQIMVAKDKIMQARVTDGNEGWYSSDIPVDWMNTRNIRSGYGNWGGWGDGGGGPGVLGYGWDSCSFSNGSAY